MLDIFAQYATDEALENNGTWFPLAGDAHLLIARSGNKAYARRLAKEVERNKPLLDAGGDAADAKSNEIMVGVLAESILLGWKHVSFKGKELPYSVENAKLLLAIKDFRKVVMQLADDMEAFKVKEEAEQGKA